MRDPVKSSVHWKTPLKGSLVALAVGISLVRLMSPAAANDGNKIDFVKDVQPIFQTSCIKCHSLDSYKPWKKAGGRFRLDDKVAAFKGGKSGAAIIPGNSKDSLLFKLLSGSVASPDSDSDRDIPPMPKAKRGEKWQSLTSDQIAIIQQWIDQGANWPN